MSACHRAVCALVGALLPAVASGATCQVAGPVATTEWPARLTFEGVPVGGLSGLAWEGPLGRLLAVSDDHGEVAPPRWLELDAALPDGDGGTLAVSLVSTVTLRDEAGRPLPRYGADPEAVVTLGDDVWIASEGFRLAGVAPFVRAFDRSGRPALDLPLPAYVLPGEGPRTGPRHNVAFESVAVSGDGATLYAGLEAALLQDGPSPEFGVASPTRILVFDLQGRRLRSEALYWVEGLTRRPLLPGGTHMGGLVELAWLAPDRLLALERAFALGAGFSIRLYEIDLAAAEDLSVRPDRQALAEPAAIRAVAKELVFDFADAPVAPRNLEGMALGPLAADGTRTLLVVSDSNFSPTEPAAQFFLLRLACAPAGNEAKP
jgi:hypothetical protein